MPYYLPILLQKIGEFEMILRQLFRTLALTLVVTLLIVPPAAFCQDKAPAKLLFKDIYFPEFVDSGKYVAYFKIVHAETKDYSRLCLGNPRTGEEKILFPDIDFNLDKIQAFTFMPDGKHVALVDKKITTCDIWLHDIDDPYGEPIRLTNLEQFDPGYTVDQLYQWGMNPKAVMEVKQMDISPDGKKILMTFGILGKTAIWMYEIDRDHYRQMTPDRKGYLPKWFPDSENFVYTMLDSVSGKFSEDLWMMEARTNKWRRLVTTTNSDGYATPSPDGEYVAYMELSNNAWNPRVVRVSDGKIGKVFDLPEGKTCNRIIWNEDGTKLYMTLTGYEGMWPALYEAPLDPKIFE
jgi:Tol biopolymer transport system component